VEITEVRIKLMEDPSERLQAFCSITFDDCFVIRDLKIIEGTNGPFVAMPSRKLTAHCHQCGSKNHLRAAYCNQCGQRLRDDRAPRDEDGRAKLYADIAHPINSTCREMIQQRVIEAFHREQEEAKQPGYVSSYDDFDHEDAFESVPAGRPAAERNEVTARPQAPAAASPMPAVPRPHMPQAPHKTPSPARSSRPSAPRTEGGFGAGIF
jgi:stage V sporulation protein G